MIKRVLLGLGGTPFTDVAIQRAVELATVHGALITGVTVVDTKRLKQIGPGLRAMRMHPLWLENRLTDWQTAG
jgi:nucleotide-binding universal stress UspA family protein